MEDIKKLLEENNVDEQVIQTIVNTISSYKTPEEKVTEDSILRMKYFEETDWKKRAIYAAELVKRGIDF